jgi:hypothetical protein
MKAEGEILYVSFEDGVYVGVFVDQTAAERMNEVRRKAKGVEPVTLQYLPASRLNIWCGVGSIGATQLDETLSKLTREREECQRALAFGLAELAKDRDASMARAEAAECKLQECQQERDRAVARAGRLAELDPDGDLSDEGMQEALKEIESLTVSNIRHENAIAGLQCRLKECGELLREWVEAWDAGRQDTDLYRRTLDVLHGRIPEIDGVVEKMMPEPLMGFPEHAASLCCPHGKRVDLGALCFRCHPFE